MAADRYIKVPHAIQSDPGLWMDDARLAAYVRLRMAYDMQWPHPAPIPRAVKAAVLDWLVEQRYVERDGERYVVRDVARDRQRRVEQTLNATFSRATEAETEAENRDTTSGLAPREGGSNGSVPPRGLTKLSDLLPGLSPAIKEGGK